MTRVSGRALAQLGCSCLLVVGAFLVLGMRLGYPYHRIVALGLWGVALVVFGLSLRARRKWLRVHKKLVRKRLRPYVPHLAVGAGLALFAYVAWVLAPVAPSELTGMPRAELRENIDADGRLVAYLDETLGRAVAGLGAVAEGGARSRTLLPAEREALFEAWQQFVHASLELDGLHRRYRGFYQIDYNAAPALHADAFHVAYAAYVAQYHHALGLVALVDAAPLLQAVLDEPSAVYGIPGQTYFRLKQRLTHPDTLLRLHAGRAYLNLVEAEITAGPEAATALRDRLAATDRLAGARPELLLENPLDWLERHAYRAWFPVQKQVALRMSELRGKDRPYFITPALARACLPKLEPGDILLERRSWHLTNAGIPGFWPHAALYTGVPREMDAYFAGLPELEGQAASAVLAASFPRAWEQYEAEAGPPCRVIEARRPGVVLLPFEESVHADYLAVLRPRVDRAAKLRALRRAFAHFGKPYDYAFDFATDEALVCSELVFKAYQGMEGIRWTPRTLNGRLLLPPNDLARRYAEEAGSADRSMDWVLFLDGREREEVAVWSTEAAFRESWRRPKWEILLD